jgi:3-oxoacyl-[acyl-carrier protein] reductase
MAGSLAGRRVVLTGSSGRLGRVLHSQLKQAGARVLGIDAAAGESTELQAQLTSEAEVETVMAEAARRLGGIDALIHVVGTWAARPLHATTLAQWQQQVDVNLTSTFLCFREALRHMRSAGAGGRLVAVSARSGIGRGPAGQAPYAAAKAGVARLVESLTEEYAALGITAAAVAPSTILFGDEEAGAAGAAAADIARFCVHLAGDGGAQHAGCVIPLYGNG